MAKTRTGAKFETKVKSYKGEKKYRKDVEKMLNDGWKVQSEQMSEHRGAMKYLLTGGLALLMGKGRHYHVTYVRGGEQPEFATAETATPTTRLAQLEEMKAQGLLQDEEYQAKRAEILAEM